MSRLGRFAWSILGGLVVLVPFLEAQTPPLAPLIKGKSLLKVSGNLTASDPHDPQKKGCHHKNYQIDLSAAKTYSIEMNKTPGSDLDPYLRLETLAGQTLARDDDSGGNLNARIIFEAPSSAKYRIIATSFPGMTGNFTLSVSELVRPTPMEPTPMEPPPMMAAPKNQETGPPQIIIIDEGELYRRPMVYRAGKIPKGLLPPWFEKLDFDKDGQIALWEWRKGGKNLKEFSLWDRDDDGFITVEEVLSKLQSDRFAPPKSTADIQDLKQDLKTTILLPQSANRWKFIPEPEAKALGQSWIQPFFDDRGWRVGQAPIGYGEDEIPKRAGTIVKERGVSFLFRREFIVPPGLLKQKGVTFHLGVASDDHADVWINGKLADQDPVEDHEFAYWNREVEVNARFFQPGRNVVAVLVKNSPGSSDIYLDMEIRAQVPSAYKVKS